MRTLEATWMFERSQTVRTLRCATSAGPRSGKRSVSRTVANPSAPNAGPSGGKGDDVHDATVVPAPRPRRFRREAVTPPRETAAGLSDPVKPGIGKGNPSCQS